MSAHRFFSGYWSLHEHTQAYNPGNHRHQLSLPVHGAPAQIPQCTRDILGFLSAVRTKQLQYQLQALPGMVPSATALVMVQSFLQLKEEVAASSRHLPRHCGRDLMNSWYTVTQPLIWALVVIAHPSQASALY